MARRGSGKRAAGTGHQAARLEVKGVELGQPARPSGLLHTPEQPTSSAVINLHTSTAAAKDFALQKLGPTKNTATKKSESSHPWQSPFVASKRTSVTPTPRLG